MSIICDKSRGDYVWRFSTKKKSMILINITLKLERNIVQSNEVVIMLIRIEDKFANTNLVLPFK